LSFLREQFRRLAHLPGFGRVAAAIEDRTDYRRIAGTPELARETLAHLVACRAPEDFISFIRPILHPAQVDGEIIGLLKLATERQVQRVLEIGTAQGGTTFLLSRAIPSTRWTLSIDLRPRHTRVLKFFNAPDRSFHALAGSSIAPAALQQVEVLLGGAPVDLLFIDGDHSYEGVKADYAHYRRFVRPGGLIVFHDIVPVANTGSPTAGHRWVGGVPEFWHEVRAQGSRSWEFVENWSQGGFGIGVLENGPSAA